MSCVYLLRVRYALRVIYPRAVCLALLNEEEWRLIPGLFSKQIPKKARDLAKLVCTSIHGQWLLWNDSISDKDTIKQDSLNRKSKVSQPRLFYITRTLKNT